MDGIRGFLTRKVGPAPVWVYMIGAAGALYYWRRKKDAAAALATANSASASSNSGTAIDPATGVPYSTELATAADAANAAGAQQQATFANGASYSGSGLSGPLLADLSGVQSTPTAANTTPPVTGAVQGQGGSWWLKVVNPTEAGELSRQGAVLGYEPSPGYFVTTKWGQGPTGVTYYTQVSPPVPAPAS
jgi:hypothetical protein